MVQPWWLSAQAFSPSPVAASAGNEGSLILSVVAGDLLEAFQPSSPGHCLVSPAVVWPRARLPTPTMAGQVPGNGRRRGARSLGPWDMLTELRPPLTPCLVKGSSQIAFVPVSKDMPAQAPECIVQIYQKHLWQLGRTSACGLPAASAPRRPVAWAPRHGPCGPAGKGLRRSPS